MPGRVDCHLHSHFSDGRDSPTQLVERARRAGLGGIALTDHDTLAGIPEAREAGEAQGIEIIPGIELSTLWEGRDVHVLGLFVDPQDRALQDYCTEFRADRLRRAREIVGRLEEMGLPLPWEAVMGRAGQGVVGRLHIADALVDEGLVASTDEVFRLYLGDGCPADVSKRAVETRAGIALLRHAGGLAILAHPGLLDPPEILERVIRLGLDGLEVGHPGHSPLQEFRLRSLARREGLLTTAGSDWHGERPESAPLGSRSLPEALRRSLRREIPVHQVGPGGARPERGTT